MLNILDEFRRVLDDIMVLAMHKRVVLYGYGYTGRFLKWYASYYHGIEVDYVVSMDMHLSQAYDQEIFRKSLFSFDYKDVKHAVVWLAEPVDEEVTVLMEENGYRKGETYFDFYDAVYGDNVYWEPDLAVADTLKKRKTGKRDIQFLEWLEWKYGCNFLTAIEQKEFEQAGTRGSTYRVTTQKEIFPVLDRCHCIPQPEDAIFDFGCGKGGALVSFLDYGFHKAGGVEYSPDIYEMLKENISSLGLEKSTELIYGDAGELKEELDGYNWFYFFSPFNSTILQRCVDAICGSYQRKKRKIRIIYLVPFGHELIEKSGIFRLTSQFTIETRQRVVDIFESHGES